MKRIFLALLLITGALLLNAAEVTLRNNSKKRLSLTRQDGAYFMVFKDTKGYDAEASYRVKNLKPNTVYEFSCKREGDTVLFTVSADGFLYNMVRILVGTVLDLHDGVLAGTPASILEAKDRSAAGRTMPPTGLCLEKVFY